MKAGQSLARILNRMARIEKQKSTGKVIGILLEEDQRTLIAES
jgi:hypothetical protein